MFISLPNKILLLLLGMILSLSLAYAWLWMSKFNDDIVLQQVQAEQQNTQQYELLNQIFRTRIESWLEFLAQTQYREAETLQALKSVFSENIEFFQINLQLNELWLLDENQKLIFSNSSEIPQEVLRLSSMVLREQRSEAQVLCSDSCYQLLSIPVLTRDGQLANITLSTSLLEIMALLNQSTEASLALVFVGKNQQSVAAKKLQLRQPISAVNRALFGRLLPRIPDKTNVTELADKGKVVNIGDQNYLINLIPIGISDEHENYLVSAHDISATVQGRQNYQRNILIFGSIIVGLVAAVCYLLTNNFRHRLLNLSRMLPFLATREYRKFKQNSERRTHFFNDELDALQSSAVQLADRLEQQDVQISQQTRKLEKMAMYDPLTSLSNRNRLVAELKASISVVNNNNMIAILFFDLDDFKKVNDSYGHAYGDALLLQASKRLLPIVDERDLVCRLGGDEFAIMLKNIPSKQQVIAVAERLLKIFQDPIKIASLKFYISISIGIGIVDNAQADIDDLIRQADVAMYEAKKAGGNCYLQYTSKMSVDAMQKVALETEAREALKNDEFSFALQPQIELKTNNLIGFEALLRWHHPKRGYISPAKFIPVLEHTDFMLALGRWCIERAFALLESFKQAGYPDLKIAVNLASIQFLDPELIPLLESKLAQTGIAADSIELELTERTLVSDMGKANQIMQQLSDLGVIISIDDFGTGYSSLSYLGHMSADIIKIDRSFVDGMQHNKTDKQIVLSLVQMVQNLGMKVVAEGIELPEQLAYLNEFGCDIGQGYLFAKPINQAQLFEQMECNLKNGVWRWQ